MAELAAREQAYREFVVACWEHLTFKGITPTAQAISLPLADIYVALAAVADVPESADTLGVEERRLLAEAEHRSGNVYELRTQLDSLRQQRWQAWGREGRRQMVRQSIEDVLAVPGRATLVILGDPGSGKSTLLHYLALETARSGLPGVQDERPAPRILRAWPQETQVLPIFVPLAAYDEHLRRRDRAMSLADFLAEYHGTWRAQPDLKLMFDQALTDGRALVLLDGLDEVLDLGARHHVTEQVRALIRRYADRGNRFVITSRVIGYREAPIAGVPHVNVVPFGDDEIATFMRRWCEAYEVWAAGERSAVALQRATEQQRALLDDVRSNPNVAQLAANPLLLTMLALLRRQVGALPERRIELYGHYVEALASRREHSRSEGARLHSIERFDWGRARQHLMELALWLQLERPSGTAQRRDLVNTLTEICLRYQGMEPGNAPARARVEAERDAERFLGDMGEIAGLVAERGHDAFGFWHLTFQEYFVGRALARMKPDERWARIAPHLHHPRWREPILLCVGQLGVVDSRRDEASDLVRRILGAQSEHESVLHRDVFLAADVIADDVGIDTAVLDELCKRLLVLRESSIRAVRRRALRGLAYLARAQHAEAAKALEAELRGSMPVDVLRTIEPAIRSAKCAALRDLAIEKLNDRGPEIRLAAVMALQSLVALDEEVCTAIRKKLDDASIYWKAYTVLGPLAISSAEIRAVILAKLDDPMAGAAAIEALGPLVASDSEIRTAILARFKDGDTLVRSAVIQALGPLAAADSEIRAMLVASLDDRNSYVCTSTIGALGPWVASDSDVCAAILSKIDEPDNRIRSAAVAALASLAPSAAYIRSVLAAQLDDPYVCADAIKALAPLVASDERIRESVTAKLDDESWLPSVAGTIKALELLVVADNDIRAAVLCVAGHEKARKNGEVRAWVSWSGVRRSAGAGAPWLL